MATYVLPQVLVFQDFTRVPAAAVNPLRAHISGPHAYLLRYDDPDERPYGKLGYYDRLEPTSYLWPTRPAGGTVDPTYTKIFIRDALLNYFTDDIGGGSVITKTAGYNNRIRSATISFAENGDDFPRSAALLDRDVQPGDILKVRGLNSDDEPITLWTYVKRVIGDLVAAVVGDAESDDSNAATNGGSVSYEQVAGVENCVTLDLDDSEYNGLVDGDVNETYDVIVLEGSVNGDFTTAKLRVISGSGRDNVAELTPEAMDVPTPIGTRGLTAAFTITSGSACSDSSEAAEVSAVDLHAGQRYQITVEQAFTAPVATSGGTYDNDRDTTYIVEVFRGGLYAADLKPQIKVTTTNGIDISGPTDVTAAATAVAVGTKSVTVQFSGTGLRKGDKYYIDGTAETAGAMKTIELGNNLDVDIASGNQLDVSLFIKKPLLEVAQNRTGFAPLVNWEVNDSNTEITVNDGIVAYDESWTDEGEAQPLDVYSEESKDYGVVYVEYRAWLETYCNEIGTIRDPATINDQISGALHPDNPLKWGVFKALENANGSEVKFTAVCEPDSVESWADCLEKILGTNEVYGLVPLTRNRTVLDLYAAHVKAQSSPEQAMWRVLWTSLEGVPEMPVIHAGSEVPGHITATTTDGEVCLCVVEDDADTSGSQYTIVRCTSNNGNFLTNDVRSGDIVRMLYTGDGFGNYSYSEFIVDEVTSEDELRLLAGPDAPIGVSSKIEIWRNLSATEEAAAVARNAGAWGDRRIRAVWPDVIESSGTLMEGYHLCAALAGLRSGILPHQGMTRLQVVGFTSLPRTIDKFNRAQLDNLAGSGTWIVTQNRTTGQVYTRHAVTTASYDDLNQREEMVTTNVDSISFRIQAHFEPFIGVTNITPSNQARLELELGKIIRKLQTEGYSTELGGQLIDATIVEFGPHAIFEDRYLLVLDAQIPKPFNNMEVHIVI